MLERRVEARSATAPGDRKLRVSQVDSCKENYGNDKPVVNVILVKDGRSPARRPEPLLVDPLTRRRLCRHRSPGIVTPRLAWSRPAPRRRRVGSGAFCQGQKATAEATLATIGVIAGDGVGPEVVREALAVLAAAAARDEFRYDTRPLRPGGRALLEDRRGLARSGPRPTSAAAMPSSWVRWATRTSPPACSRRGSSSGSGSSSTST